MSRKTGCELCSRAATMFCDSDQASLCWDCDEKVHAANFLVAKHSRTLLCHVCQAPTPWKAAGLKLAPTLSVCRACASANRGLGDDDDSSDSCETGNDDEDEDSSEEEGEEEEGENQVVPFSASMGAGSSTSEDVASYSSSKRPRNNALQFESEEEDNGFYSSSSSKHLRISK